MLSERLLVEFVLAMHKPLLIVVQSFKIRPLRERLLTCCFYNFILANVTPSAIRLKLKGGYGIVGRRYRWL